MGIRGPRPKSTELRILQGNPGKRVLSNGNFSDEERKSPEPPDYLSDESKEIWNLLADELTRKGLLDEGTAFPFARYCDMVVIWHILKARCDELGLVYEAKKEDSLGNLYSSHTKKRPEISMIIELNSELLRLEREFGLTPQSREQAVPESQKRSNEVSDFITGVRKTLS